MNVLKNTCSISEYSMGDFHKSRTNTTIAPSNLNIILFVGMGVYSNSSKFQSDSTFTYELWHFKNHGFPMSGITLTDL